MENEKWKVENGKWKMENRLHALKPDGILHSPFYIYVFLNGK